MRYASNPATSPGEVTNPCIRFPSYQNLGMGHLAAGFDTHGDLIAAATDDGRVIIWDGQSASELKEEKWNKATCLKFIDEPETPKVLRLMGTAGQSIVGLAW